MEEIYYTNGVRLIRHEDSTRWTVYLRGSYVEAFESKEDADTSAREKLNSEPVEK